MSYDEARRPTETTGPSADAGIDTLSVSKLEAQGQALDPIPADWHVFPVERAGKRPWGGLPWRQVSRPRADWGASWPPEATNIGIDCGKSGLVVLDEDELGAVDAWLGYEPLTYTVSTGRGRHFYFYAVGCKFRNRVRLAPGVDVRAEGGYVVGPGSLHENGSSYAVVRATGIAPLPPEIRVHNKDEMVIDLDLSKHGRFELPEVIGEGERNDTLFRYACSLVARNLRDDERLDLLRLAYRRCSVPYNDESPEALLIRALREYGRSDEVGEAHPTGFVMLDIVALLDPNRPPRRWLWDGMIPEGESASIVSPAGVGKSLLVLALVIDLLLGEREFIGRQLGWADDRKVLYVDMENSEEDWAERLPDLGLTNKLAEEILGKTFFPFSLPPLSGLDSSAGGRQLLGLIDDCGLQAGDLVVLDSTQRITEGDENSNDTMRALYRHTSTALKRRGLTVIRTDNTGWAKEHERGASSKRDDVGVSLMMQPDDKKPGVYSLAQSKRRFAGTREGNLAFERVGGNGDRLRFIPAKATSFGDKAQEVRDLLDSLDVDVEAGQRKAWNSIKEAADHGVIERPNWMTSRLVMKVQSERREMPVIGPCHDDCGDPCLSHPDRDSL